MLAQLTMNAGTVGGQHEVVSRQEHPERADLDPRCASSVCTEAPQPDADAAHHLHHLAVQAMPPSEMHAVLTADSLAMVAPCACELFCGVRVCGSLQTMLTAPAICRMLHKYHLHDTIMMNSCVMVPNTCPISTTSR